MHTTEVWDHAKAEKTFLKAGEVYKNKSLEYSDDQFYFCTQVMVASVGEGMQSAPPLPSQCLIGMTTGCLWTHIHNLEEADEWEVVTLGDLE